MQMVLTGIMLCVVIFSSIYWSFYVEDIKYEKVENEMMPFERIYIEAEVHCISLYVLYIKYLHYHKFY